MNPALIDLMARYEFDMQDKTERHFKDAEMDEQEHFRKLARQLVTFLRREGYAIVSRDPAAEALKELYAALLAVGERAETRAG